MIRLSSLYGGELCHPTILQYQCHIQTMITYMTCVTKPGSQNGYNIHPTPLQLTVMWHQNADAKGILKHSRFDAQFLVLSRCSYCFWTNFRLFLDLDS